MELVQIAQWAVQRLPWVGKVGGGINPGWFGSPACSGLPLRTKQQSRDCQLVLHLSSIEEEEEEEPEWDKSDLLG